MKLNVLKSMAFAAVLAGFAGCANDDTYGVPQNECIDPGLAATKTVQEIDALANSVPTQYPTGVNDVIEAYVTSSDERGNFFKSVSMQTLPTDGSAPIGFSVAIDDSSLFAKRFTPGRKVFVKLDGLYYAIADGSLKIGQLFENQVGRIAESEYASRVIPACEAPINEDLLVRQLTVAEAKNNDNINTLIELKNVQFADQYVGGTYYDSNDEIGGASNRILIDNAGNEIIFRTSSFANFSGSIITEKSGTVRGVLTKFGSDFQFLARSEDDINLTEPRNVGLGGTEIVYSGSFTENFESYAAGVKFFPSYVNVADEGTRYWAVTAFSGNKYIQMTSFGGTPEANRTLFIVPVDMTAANGFSFQSKAGFSNGQALKVYYTLDYLPGQDIANATLVDITSNFTISPGQASGYPANFTNSGTWNIPASITGNGFFVFEYTGNGNGGVTTTIQIDNIVVN